MIQCWQCSEYHNEATCPICGSPKVKPEDWEQKVLDSNADFLGFSEAKRMYETRNAWKKIGS